MNKVSKGDLILSPLSLLPISMTKATSGRHISPSHTKRKSPIPDLERSSSKIENEYKRLHTGKNFTSRNLHRFLTPTSSKPKLKLVEKIGDKNQ